MDRCEEYSELVVQYVETGEFESARRLLDDGFIGRTERRRLLEYIVREERATHENEVVEMQANMDATMGTTLS
jgi:hypothetical protein